MRSRAEIILAIANADAAMRTTTSGQGRLMALAVADALRWAIGDDKDGQINVALDFIHDGL